MPGNFTLELICPTPLAYLDSNGGPPHSYYLPVAGNCASPCPTVAFTNGDWETMIRVMIVLVYISSFASFLVLCAHVIEFKKHFIRVMFIGGFCGNSIIMAAFLTANNYTGLRDSIVCSGSAYFIEKSSFCVFQAAAMIWFFMWTNTWSSILAVDTYLRVSTEIKKEVLRTLRIKYVVIGITIPTIITLIPLLANNLGFDPEASIPICLYLVSQNKTYFWVSFVLPFYLILLVALIFTGLTVHRVHVVLISSRYYERNRIGSDSYETKNPLEISAGSTGIVDSNGDKGITKQNELTETSITSAKFGTAGLKARFQQFDPIDVVSSRFAYESDSDDDDDKPRNSVGSNVDVNIGFGVASQASEMSNRSHNSQVDSRVFDFSNQDSTNAFFQSILSGDDTLSESIMSRTYNESFEISLVHNNKAPSSTDSGSHPIASPTKSAVESPSISPPTGNSRVVSVDLHGDSSTLEKHGDLIKDIATSADQEPTSSTCGDLWRWICVNPCIIVSYLASGRPQSRRVMTKQARLFSAMWTYHGRTMLFVVVFCLTTLCVLPLAFNLYLIHFNGYVDSAETFEECLIEASILSPVQTQEGVNSFAEERCGLLPSYRPNLGEELAILCWAAAYGIIPSILFGFGGQLTRLKAYL